MYFVKLHHETLITAEMASSFFPYYLVLEDSVTQWYERTLNIIL